MDFIGQINDPLLRVENLTKFFDIHLLKTQLPAFENISFKLNRGEFILLRGPNGVGKSTLLRTLYRSCVPRGGHVYYASDYGVIDLACASDIDIALMRRKEIGFVTQFLQPRPRVSAQDLVAEPLLNAGEDKQIALEKAQDYLAAFGVKQALWQAYPSTFSGGEQQKVNLARALIVPQKLLFLDEPTASLDVVARAALIKRLQELKENGTAMIGVFHHREDVEDLIDREIDLSPMVKQLQ
ncbi:phosphonate C-P lyase system protein PhnL [Bartonella sp. HY761]|uniref:phosphonate C-P lyase system protein PhnL n=1 Tax=Bartonella sp. HY761 TaxID=2979330 RepID=UPI0021F959C4|nr:ATP-binding cassette domain-containing protein [Bartonella sp. HY761]UXN05899.1 ATP-binding cassette domain-containing protein [Bartonella sp. HY761]